MDFYSLEWNRALKSAYPDIASDLKRRKKNNHWIWYIFPTDMPGRRAKIQFSINQNIFDNFCKLPNFDRWVRILENISSKNGNFFPEEDLGRIKFSLPMLYKFTYNSTEVPPEQKDEILSYLQIISLMHLGRELVVQGLEKATHLGASEPVRDEHTSGSTSLSENPFASSTTGVTGVEDLSRVPTTTTTGVDTDLAGKVPSTLPPVGASASGPDLLSSTSSEREITLPRRVLVNRGFRDLNYQGTAPWGMKITHSSTNFETIQGFNLRKGVDNGTDAGTFTGIDALAYHFAFLVDNCFIRRKINILNVALVFVYGPNTASPGQTDEGSQRRTFNELHASQKLRKNLRPRKNELPLEFRIDAVRNAIKESYTAAIEACHLSGQTHLVCCIISGGIYSDDKIKNCLLGQDKKFGSHDYRTILIEIFRDRSDLRSVSCVLVNYNRTLDLLNPIETRGVSIERGDSLEVAEQIISRNPYARVAVMIAGNAGRPFGNLGEMNFSGLTHLPPYTPRYRDHYYKTQEEDLIAFWMQTVYDFTGNREDANAMYNYVINGIENHPDSRSIREVYKEIYRGALSTSKSTSKKPGRSGGGTAH